MSKIKEQLPMLSTKNDTIYRYIKTLIDKGMIAKVPKLDYYRVKNKGLIYEFDLYTTGNKSEDSEINPEPVGNKSDSQSEKNPTYNNTKDNIKNDNNTYGIGETPNGENSIIPLEDQTEKITTPLPPSYGKQEINQVIEKIKSSCKLHGLVYSGDARDRQFASYLISKKFAGDIEEFNMTLPDFIDNIIKAGAVMKYGKPVTSAKTIYYNRADVINNVRRQKLQEGDKKKPVYILT